MTHYQIATVLSFVTACFTLASCWTKDPHRAYWYQVGQCLVYSGAAYFFGVYPCIVMMLINATRNFLVATDRYKAVYCYIFSAVALVVGLAINTSGIIGLITVLATVQYSICSYYLKKDLSVKINITINMLLWLCYDILVLDVFSGIVDSVGVVLALITFARILADKRKTAVSEPA